MADLAYLGGRGFHVLVRADLARHAPGRTTAVVIGCGSTEEFEPFAALA
ncbi:hypothetical protein ACO0M4_27260 [Streptomyces sp. RGM 3693]